MMREKMMAWSGGLSHAMHQMIVEAAGNTMQGPLENF